MNKLTYNRENDLKDRINSFLRKSFDLPDKDYYANLNAEDFIALKSALSDINNILTLKVTLSFADWLSEKYKLDESGRKALNKIVFESKPNSNGYDIWLNYPVAFVGEVKCNIPINNGSIYGSAQRIGIEKDIVGLLNGKRKAELLPHSSPKFLAFLDLPKIRSANKHLLRVSEVCKNSLVFVDNDTKLDRLDIVYGVYVQVNA